MRVEHPYSSLVLDIPVEGEVSLDSLALVFDISRPEITRCNGMSGRQILTPSILVPITAGLAVGSSQRIQSRGPAADVPRFMKEVGSDECSAKAYLSLYPGSYEDAVEEYRLDEEWGKENAWLADAPPPYNTTDAGSAARLETTTGTSKDETSKDETSKDETSKDDRAATSNTKPGEAPSCNPCSIS